METHFISPGKLVYHRIFDILRNDYKLALSEESVRKIIHCREYLDQKLASTDGPVYGINTGFGSLCNVEISKEELSDLQKNLVMSHACGFGDEVPKKSSESCYCSKYRVFRTGIAGYSYKPCRDWSIFSMRESSRLSMSRVPLGASGDLSPLAHLSLPLLGLGEVNYRGRRMPSDEAIRMAGIQPVELKSKEGLALLNGTQFMGAYGVYCLMRSFRLSILSDIIGALSLDAFDGRPEPFYAPLHEIRQHKGQIRTAERIRKILDGSQLLSRPKADVQDPYSFRCIPQVHGASKDSINYVAYVFSCEMNAVTDNPTIFPDEDLIISGGNFHGQPLALALDNLAIALSELGNISERRTYQLIAGKRSLPHFLVAQPGLNSGFMIPQYTAASIVSQNKQLCTPASVDSIESSQGQEDHVSMGANAATKALRVVNNLERILAIELFNAAQALEFRRPACSSPFIEDFVAAYRKEVPFIENDVWMHPHMEATVHFIRSVPLNIPDALIPGI